MSKLRIGCVPYLNAKPLIQWFHTAECGADAEITYAVPSELARLLEEGRLDTALVSTFELFRRPTLTILPDLSISADGPVKSVRLFSRVPFAEIDSVALDTSSLTSVALVRILLKERFNVSPRYTRHPPHLATMLADCDAGLIIGDLKLFDFPADHILDLGETWKQLTGLPFVYAAWLAREDAPMYELTTALTHARAWGEARLEELSVEWAQRMDLPLERVQDYFRNVMQYDLDAEKSEALRQFQKKCFAHGLIESMSPLHMAGE